MTRLGFLLAVAAVAAFFFVNVRVSEAESVGARQMAIVIADRDAVGASSESVDLFESLFGLLTTLRPEDRMAFVPVQEPEDVVGPVGGSEADLSLLISDIDGILAGTPLEPASLVDAMIEANTVMGDERALAGSDIYLIVGGADRVELDKHHSSLAPLLSRFQDNGWRVNGLIMPETKAATKQFLGKMAQDSGGSVYDLSTEGGFTVLGQAILSEDIKGSLSPLGERELGIYDLMTTVIDVPPGTEETTVIIVKESPGGSLRISSPDGQESSQGDRSSSSVVETPYLVAWKLTDPAVGSWEIDIDSLVGRVSVWSHSTNRYSLALGNTDPIPTGQPVTISAYITEDGRVVRPQGVTVVARVTSPDGANLAYTMNDRGENGDAVARDGYYSVELGPLQSVGDYETVLEMWWPDESYTVSSDSIFTASAFPALRVESGTVSELESGARTLVATVYVHVQGEPYAVQPNQLKAAIATPFEQGRQPALGQGKAAQLTDGQSLPAPDSAPEGLGTLEVVPQRLFGEGPAWEYQVYYTPGSEGTRDLFFDLDVAYAGVQYSHSSEALRLTSLAPVAPEAPVAVAAITATEAAPTSPAPVAVTVPVTASPKPAAVVAETQTVALWPFVLVLVIAVVAIATALGYLLTQSRPRGYLYNDLNEPIVDFSKLNRGPAVALFLKNLVPGKDLNIPELSGLVFMFTRSGIKLRSAGEHPTVRVNNQPLINEAEIDDRTWIGSGGKLFTFMLSPAQEPDPAPMAAPMPAEA